MIQNDIIKINVPLREMQTESPLVDQIHPPEREEIGCGRGCIQFISDILDNAVQTCGPVNQKHDM